MHLVLHIFRKDVRRLWWGIAIALAAQVAISYQDAVNGTGNLDIVQFVAWAGLLAMAVHEDPLVGDRQFWLTRPVRWRILLTSKLLFAAAVIHIPSLLGDVLILAARGFQPWEWIPQLVVRQLVLAAGFSLPMIALAAVVQNFAYLALTTIAIAGTTDYLSGVSQSLYSQWGATDGTLSALVAIVLGSAAAVVVLQQYTRRRTWRSGGVGLAAVVLVELAIAFLSPVFLARIRAAIHPWPGTIAVHLAPKRSLGTLASLSDSGWVGVAVPVEISGLPGGGVGSLFDITKIEIDAGGQTYRTSTLRNGSLASAAVQPMYMGPDWLVLRIRRALYNEIQQTKVQIKATVVVALHRRGRGISVPPGTHRAIAGAGLCSSEPYDNVGYSGEVVKGVNVLCESPGGFPLHPTAFSGTEEPLFEALGSWLSPQHRASTSIHGYRLRDDVAIVPDTLLGWQVLDLALPDIQLGDYAESRSN